MTVATPVNCFQCLIATNYVLCTSSMRRSRASVMLSRFADIHGYAALPSVVAYWGGQQGASGAVPSMGAPAVEVGSTVGPVSCTGSHHSANSSASFFHSPRLSSSARAIVASAVRLINPGPGKWVEDGCAVQFSLSEKSISGLGDAVAALISALSNNTIFVSTHFVTFENDDDSLDWHRCSRSFRGLFSQSPWNSNKARRGHNPWVGRSSSRKGGVGDRGNLCPLHLYTPRRSNRSHRRPSRSWNA
ncbi:uncharacterized protein C8Q71DRAFT_495658 [Rhodofomes roseus]|uniref:Uncharacterized protein n=1 Tax=Rhodofomes roseus TaxID=34475 RepID=A0ABQ8KLB3_9APHY|nr:uncharacterized protein C8Q71DRAFT_495658 [Rhodofomes roseus]KAH9839097.1 hypothetical protein C8Q71DRAFT_495658 [Rhodofomes roseus]